MTLTLRHKCPIVGLRVTFQCIGMSEQCDGRAQCADGLDERSCHCTGFAFFTETYTPPPPGVVIISGPRFRVDKPAAAGGSGATSDSLNNDTCPGGEGGGSVSL